MLEVLLAVAMAVSPPGGPASPAGEECRGRDGASVCVVRAGEWIQRVWAVRDEAGWVCDYVGALAVYDGEGRKVYQTRSRINRGCSYGRVWAGGIVNREGRRVCASWWERGGRRHVATACAPLPR
ncbi:hypothetical protein [Spirillospora sp. NPDC047279]|uniref:hypothetical protein n=1 Tax=Spirillospora sp. NPDC047279 TaxID=3155478 RepID=UPI0033D2F53D